ncbi:MAG: thiamine phosphate synthase [Planctomycetes bacterium]|nr:thiamine phosphate synthase [Planctomycetota bacterium]
MRSEHRLLDAAANRAREGLRTLEDVLRFALDRADLLERAKQVRHRLAAALGRFPAGLLEAHRDAVGDEGRHVRTEREMERGDLRDVAVAATKRATEALRSLEEVGKMVDAAFARDIAAMRYLMYDLERDAILALGSPLRRQPRVCVLLTESLCKRPWMEVLRGALEGRADMIQVREKNLTDRALLERVRRIREVAHAANALVVVNDRTDIALAAGADGVHLGSDDISIREARKLAGMGLLLGASTHDTSEALAAVSEGADYCGVGTIFASGVKPDRAPCGVGLVTEFIRHYPRVPHLAIGGITVENIGQLAAAGCRGVAVSSAVCAADDPAAAVGRLREALVPAAAGCAAP